MPRASREPLCCWAGVPAAPSPQSAARGGDLATSVVLCVGVSLQDRRVSGRLACRPALARGCAACRPCPAARKRKEARKELGRTHFAPPIPRPGSSLALQSAASLHQPQSVAIGRRCNWHRLIAALLRRSLQKTWSNVHPSLPPPPLAFGCAPSCRDPHAPAHLLATAPCMCASPSQLISPLGCDLFPCLVIKGRRTGDRTELRSQRASGLASRPRYRSSSSVRLRLLLE